jgi:hypothetical protein
VRQVAPKTRETANEQHEDEMIVMIGPVSNDAPVRPAPAPREHRRMWPALAFGFISLGVITIIALLV